MQTGNKIMPVLQALFWPSHKIATTSFGWCFEDHTSLIKLTGDPEDNFNAFSQLNSLFASNVVFIDSWAYIDSE